MVVPIVAISFIVQTKMKRFPTDVVGYNVTSSATSNLLINFIVVSRPARAAFY